MRLFIVSQTESFVTNRGQRHPDLAKFLKSRGVEVVYLSSNYYHAEKRYFSKAEIEAVREKNAGIIQEYFKVPAYYKNIGIRRIWTNLFFAVRIWKFLKERVRSEDSVIIASRPIESLYALSTLKRAVGFKLVMDVRDIWPDAFNISKRIYRRLFHLYCNAFLIPSLRHYDYFLYTCPSFTSWIDRYTNKPDKLFSPLGFDPVRFQSEIINTPRVKDDISTKLVLIGLMQRQCNVLPLIEALNDFPNISLDIYGDDGSGELYGLVFEACLQSKNSNVNMRGLIDRDLVPSVLTKYDIGVVPFDAEHALNNKFFDYVALSLPIFTMGENDISRIVAKERIGWHTSFDITEIKNTLNKIETEQEYYIEASKNLIGIRERFNRINIFSRSMNFLSK